LYTCFYLYIINCYIVNYDDELEAINSLVEDSSEINEPNRVVHARNLNYFEDTIPRYNIDNLKNHFCMSRAAFEVSKINILQQNIHNCYL